MNEIPSYARTIDGRSGVAACLLALGLHLLGHRDVAVYDGSWSEWGAREGAPIST